MASLGELVTKLRLEVGHSSSAATGINMRDQLVYLLNRAQEEIQLSFEFNFLLADRDVPIVAGARYYAYPADLPFGGVQEVYLIWNTLYGRLTYGIGPEQFAQFNSNTGFTSWPVSRWQHNTDLNLFELWPIPSIAPVATPTSQAALVRLRGTRIVPPMVADSDMATLPDTAIVLWAAAEMLAREGAKDAQFKLDKAKAYLRRFQVRQNAHKSDPFVMGGGDVNQNTGLRIGLDYVPEGYGSGPTR